MASIMLLTVFFNSLVGSIVLLVVTGVVVFLGTAKVIAKVVVGSIPEGSDTVYLTSKRRDCLGGAFPTALGAGTGVA